MRPPNIAISGAAKLVAIPAAIGAPKLPIAPPTGSPTYLEKALPAVGKIP
jgi:hypothetical protein